ncbi:low-affinity zinc ion transporter-like protein [Phyllosticta paracitricarpa]|uniref:Low-affinity zinc ion transporter-like protein n=1 Tax=Phyllosticta paracitricarpa TaxID=2016321 RepID=A0ABR1MTW1_9PEZI
MADAVTCSSDNDYDGRMGLRISSIFVILVGSVLGMSLFPRLCPSSCWKRRARMGLLFAKYFGSGVIIATAFIHLLEPAGIALMTIFVIFFVELIVMRYARFGQSHDDDLEKHRKHAVSPSVSRVDTEHEIAVTNPRKSDQDNHERSASAIHGHDQNGHLTANDDFPDPLKADSLVPETYSAQLTAIFILEFGVIFHSVFIGLTLAVSGDEFITLYIVLVFHQTFEGLGLGSRLSSIPWPASKRWTPYALAIGYGLSTPIAIAIGLGVRKSYPPESQRTLITSGVFDSISAGILIYTGLVELMAHEFMFSPSMRKASISKVLSAFGLMVLGAGLMALLGKWA